MKRSRSQRKTGLIVALAAALLAVSAGGYLVLIAPQRSKASDLDARIADTRVQLGAYRVGNRDPKEPVQIAELFDLTKAMPDTEDMPDVLLELSRVAEDTGIVIQSITPTAAVTGAGYDQLPLDVVFEGDFYDVSDFLYRLRNLVSVRDGKLRARGRLFSVESVNFAEGVPRFPQLQATVKLSAFVYKPSTPAAGSAPAAGQPTTPAPVEGTTALGATG
jgi:hypothetical protein